MCFIAFKYIEKIENVKILFIYTNFYIIFSELINNY